MRIACPESVHGLRRTKWMDHTRTRNRPFRKYRTQAIKELSLHACSAATLMTQCRTIVSIVPESPTNIEQTSPILPKSRIMQPMFAVHHSLDNRPQSDPPYQSSIGYSQFNEQLGQLFYTGFAISSTASS